MFTSIERARIESAKVRCEEITYLALDSCFSRYAREIFEDYGLMMLWKDETSFVNEYQSFAEKNCEYKLDMAVKPMDILSIEENESYISKLKMVTSEDGELIEKQIYNYMKLSVPGDIIEELLNNSKTLSQSEGISEFNDKMENCSEALNNVEESVESISDMVNTISSSEENPVQMLDGINSKITRLKILTEEENIEEAEGVYKEILKEYSAFENWATTMYENIRSILTDSNLYLVNISDAKDEVNSVENFLTSNKGSYQQKVYELMKSEMDDVKEEILSADNDVYGVIENRDISLEQGRIILNVKKDLEDSQKLIEEYGNMKFSDIEDKQYLIEVMEKDIAEAKNDISGFDNQIFNVNYEKKSGKEQKNEIVDFVNKIKENGVINYVVSGNVSDKKVDIKSLPSNTCDLNEGKEWKNYGEIENATRKALVGQYIFDNFICYTNKADGECLNYEIEYILKGKSSDKENINEIIDDILLIREGFNFVYLLGDSQKKQEAYGLAAAITGFTGMPVVIRITQALILAAWAYAESVVDVKELLEGKRVSIIKNTDEWNLSLTGIKELSSKEQKTENKSGLLYEDYLRVFLFSQNKAMQIYRVLDVIQLNISKKYNANFKVKDCIVSVEVKSEYKVERLFTDIGFIRDMINKKNKGYLINVNQKYAY